MHSNDATILVVDDQPLVLDTAALILRRAGFRVLTSEDGRAALETVEAHDGPIHLALLDVVMPGMTGPELCEELAARSPRLRVLFMSGYTHKEMASCGVHAGPQDFIRKPFRPADLVHRVNAALDDPLSARA